MCETACVNTDMVTVMPQKAFCYIAMWLSIQTRSYVASDVVI